MKKRPSKTMEQWRIRNGPTRSDETYGNNGQFLIPWPGGEHLLLVHISDGGDWDHASVSLRRVNGEPIGRCPTWEEMCYVKEMFFKADECVIQFHPPASANINVHRYCLHLWRPQEASLPMPPNYMV